MYDSVETCNKAVGIRDMTYTSMYECHSGESCRRAAISGIMDESIQAIAESAKRRYVRMYLRFDELSCCMGES